MFVEYLMVYLLLLYHCTFRLMSLLGNLCKFSNFLLIPLCHIHCVFSCNCTFSLPLQTSRKGMLVALARNCYEPFLLKQTQWWSLRLLWNTLAFCNVHLIFSKAQNENYMLLLFSSLNFFLHFPPDENALYAGPVIKNTFYFLLKSFRCLSPFPTQHLPKMLNSCATKFEISKVIS